MRVSCLQENLARGLSIVGRAISTRSTLPVLSNVLLSTDQGRLKLSATNLELGITCWIGAKVDEEGEITVPARLLIDLVNSLPPERIDMSLSVRTQKLHLSCLRNEADIMGIDAQEFPLVLTASGDPLVSFEPETLRRMIDRVAFAAGHDESRPILTGVLMQMEDHTLTMAAADGYRLSVCTAALDQPLPEPVQVIVPARTFQELARISTEEEAPIGLSLAPSHNQVLFHLSGDAGANKGRVFGIDVVSQLIEGEFPNFRQIIPSSWETRTTLSTETFLNACRTASIFARTEANIVSLKIEPSDAPTEGKVVVSASSAEMGDNVTELDAVVEGAPLEIAFNVRYLLDVLEVIDSPQVVIETIDASRPGTFRPAGDSSFVHVIMPMVRTR